eukprot:CAMPEP_0197823188 /NCGR_PEP_ID=MMETSP1437-20131217/518_1 /TAXON_ID=49252 ORGANISM="Eucampia antarctica, Strain CCMP1452" /NCGR_SAMPLE_ID=MMETSP1437 /ASSEMBLY_ACC=CAM_ASM_001096 /LENGTH=86 /DNA_ID=CAMNT_0043422215 /DNA_START=36 /DNA_END=293 /DNA_ORIENTATION=+
MMKKTVISVLIAAISLEDSSAFTSQQQCKNNQFSLHAVSDRREILGNFAKAIGVAGLIATGGNQFSGNDASLLLAGQNPAQWGKGG